MHLRSVSQHCIRPAPTLRSRHANSSGIALHLSSSSVRSILPFSNRRTYITDLGFQSKLQVASETSLQTLGLIYFNNQLQSLKEFKKAEGLDKMRMNFEHIENVKDLNVELKKITREEHENAAIALQHGYAYFRRFMVSSHRSSMKHPVNPDGESFRILMKACYNAGAAQCVFELLSTMKDKFGLGWKPVHIVALYLTSMKSGTPHLIQHSLKLAVEYNCAKLEWFEPGWERCKQLGEYLDAIEVLRAMNSGGFEVPEEWKQEARGFLGLYRSKKLRESTEHQDKYLKEPLSEQWQSMLQDVHVS